MTVLVTGGAGYIGSHTVRQLTEQGRPVVVLDNLELGYREALLGAPLEIGDIDDPDTVTRVIDTYEVDSVIHFAAYKNAGESVVDPGKYFDNNVAAMARLLDALESRGVRRIVFSGSCSVYGTPRELPVGEDAPLQPESPYGQSKLMGEQMLRWYGEAYGLQWLSLRYFNAAGAAGDGTIGEDSRHSLNLIPVVMNATLGLRPPVKVFGTDFPTPDGTAIRDYVHVEDLAAGHLRALDHLTAGGASGAVNLGTGTGSSVHQVIEATGRISGRDVPHELTDRRPGDPAAVYADNRHARQLLGWEPSRGLDEIIESAWRWHSTRPEGYGAAKEADRR